MDSTPVMIFIEAMHQLLDKVEDGYFIAKQVIKINTLDIGKKVRLESNIEKSGRLKSMSYLICNCEVRDGHKNLMDLESTLIKKDQYNLKEKFICTADKKFFKIVTKDDVRQFCDLSGDYNYVHRGDKPVVQAMLILLLLEDYLALKKIYMYDCKITYVKPISAGSSIFLYWKGNRELFGITDNRVCFKLELRGENREGKLS
ncbi:MAG TPA: hypothetical protein DC034_05955 [Clostridium sp.]|jgi:uncharacterized pyridoxamine 5'-phosphate oxidase family protein|nr:hypothetical protein [uncultured Clostridium sp.]HBC96322.1 hypothetical protein [Clostridium sp.]